MILKKIIVDGKVAYEPISFEDALYYDDKDNLVFTDEDEKEDFEDRLEEIEEEEEDRDHEEDEEDEDDEDDEEYVEKEEDEDDDYDGNEKARRGKRSSGGFHNFFQRAFNFDLPFGSKHRKKGKTSSILSALPFLDDEDLNELLDNFLKNPEDLEGLNISAMMPFLSQEKCDELFIAALDGNIKNLNIVAIVPFVSKEALSNFVDKYIDGMYQEVCIDAVYPFLSSKDVKRIFYYEISKKKKAERNENDI